MSTRTIEVPAVDGVDLDFRPRSYFGPLPLETRLLAQVTGHARREILRVQLASGNLDYPPELQESTLDEEMRRAIGRMHPMFMGGEYLPPLAKNETEIARISLKSVTADQISVRARRLKRRIAYRVVDEYPEDRGVEGLRYRLWPASSSQPLTLRQLVAVIETACEGGIVWPPLEHNATYGDLDRLRDFVTVSSEFYPELECYYSARIAAWFAARAAQETENETH